MGEKTKNKDKTALSALRQVASTNLQFYTQADKKAQILVHVNALMISALLGGAVELSLIHRLAILPVACQIFFSTVVIILGLRSTRPVGVLSRHFGDRMEDLMDFRDYDQIEKNQYMTDMKDMAEDPDRIYACLTQNIYFQSQVLSRKYRYLHWAYIVFVAGLGINVLAAIGIALY